MSTAFYIQDMSEFFKYSIELATNNADVLARKMPNKKFEPHTLLMACIKQLNATKVEKVLQYCVSFFPPKVFQIFLNETVKNGNEHTVWPQVDLPPVCRATLIGCAVMVAATNAKQAKQKIAIINMLLDAGATNLNGCYYTIGTSGPSAYTGLFMPNAMQHVTPEDHAALVKRFVVVKGNPFKRPHPLAPCAYELAFEYYPDLVELLPKPPVDAEGFTDTSVVHWGHPSGLKQTRGNPFNFKPYTADLTQPVFATAREIETERLAAKGILRET